MVLIFFGTSFSQYFLNLYLSLCDFFFFPWKTEFQNTRKPPTSALFQIPYYGPDTKIAFAARVWSQGLCAAISWSVSIWLFVQINTPIDLRCIWGIHSGNLVMELSLIGCSFLLLVGWVELLISAVLKSGPVACDIYSVLQFKKGKSLLSTKHRSCWLPKKVFHRKMHDNMGSIQRYLREFCDLYRRWGYLF